MFTNIKNYDFNKLDMRIIHTKGFKKKQYNTLNRCPVENAGNITTKYESLYLTELEPNNLRLDEARGDPAGESLSHVEQSLSCRHCLLHRPHHRLPHFLPEQVGAELGDGDRDVPVKLGLLLALSL